MTTLSEDDFYTQFKPIPNPRDGGDFWDHDLDIREYQAANPFHVWTAVDGDNGNTVVLNGYHWVNRFAFMVTEFPWPDNGVIDGHIEVEFDDNHCEHKTNEEHMYCASCGHCREDLDDEDLCGNCQ